MKSNLYLSFLTAPAPTSNYRGESEGSRTVIQKLSAGAEEYPVISPESIKSALRDIWRHEYGLPCNRERVNDAGQPTVSFDSYPDPEKYADDFYFGYLVTGGNKSKKGKQDEEKDDTKGFKRDSIVRMNLAMGSEPYRTEALLQQSPHMLQRLDDGKTDKLKWENSPNSALLHREVAYTAFQFPVALSLRDCKLDSGDAKHKEWFRGLLRALSELSGVAGNHARSYFEFAPVSCVARLTPRLASGFPLYPFSSNEANRPSEVLQLIRDKDVPASEFLLAGEFVRKMDETEYEELKEMGCQLFRTPEQLLDKLAHDLVGLPLFPPVS